MYENAYGCVQNKEVQGPIRNYLDTNSSNKSPGYILVSSLLLFTVTPYR